MDQEESVTTKENKIMDYHERKFKGFIKEGLCLHLQMKRLKATGNPYATIDAEIEVEQKELNEAADCVYKHLYEMGMIK